MAAIYQAADGSSVYDLGGQTLYANGPNAGKIYGGAPAATASNPNPTNAPESSSFNQPEAVVPGNNNAAAVPTNVPPVAPAPAAPAPAATSTAAAPAAPSAPAPITSSSGLQLANTDPRYKGTLVGSAANTALVIPTGYNLGNNAYVKYQGQIYEVNDGMLIPANNPYVTSAPDITTFAPGYQAPGTTTTPTVPNQIQSTAAGSTATDLYQYYTAKGQTLPTVAQSAVTYAKLGLGTAAEYTGTAAQNEELLSALQRQDLATTTIGAPAGSSASSAAALNSTDAGVSLAAALSGPDAATTLANYKTYLTTALGVASSTLSTDQSAVTSFLSTEEDPDQILQDAMDSAGVTSGNSMLAELSQEITDQTTTLENLPDAIKNTLADVGVSQDQLTRLTAAETKGPTQALSDLMTKYNATQTEINTATSYAQKFADTKIAAQAAKLAALEWQVTTDKSEYDSLDADSKTIITAAIDDQKTIQTTALTAAQNGASADVVDAILSSGSGAAAVAAAGSTLVKPKATAATTSMTNDITTAGSSLETGVPSKGYNGRGADGYVDPNLYTALYNAALAQYGSAGAAAFMKKYPPDKDINPAALSEGILPQEVANAVTAAQSKKSGSGSSAGGQTP